MYSRSSRPALKLAIKESYAKTKQLLQVYKEFDNDDFWNLKREILYPKHEFIPYYTAEQNYLCASRQFALFIDDTKELIVSPQLVEWTEGLVNQLKAIKELSCNKYTVLTAVKISLKPLNYKILKRGEDDVIVDWLNSDYESECYEFIRKDAALEDYDCDYYILTMNRFGVCLMDIGIIRETKWDEIEYEWVARLEI